VPKAKGGDGFDDGDKKEIAEQRRKDEAKAADAIEGDTHTHGGR
jgi:hypothetical protein